MNSCRAFTLLEVMVAMAIMAIVMVSVYRMHSQTLTMNAAARFYTQAPLLAQSKLAQLEAASSEINAGDSGDFGDNFALTGVKIAEHVVDNPGVFIRNLAVHIIRSADAHPDANKVAASKVVYY